MEYIFLSPHLDDVSLSCGGIVNQLSTSGNHVQIWTIFAGDPPSENYPAFAESLHHRWKLSENIINERRIEDLNSSEILGAKPQHFLYPDCIYRFFENNIPVVQREEDLYQNISENQTILVDNLADRLNLLIQPGQTIVAPLSIGNHLDHQIVYESIKKLDHRPTYYYTDYPYILKSNTPLYAKLPKNYTRKTYILSEEDIFNWHQSISAYQSQISTFWPNEKEMIKEIIKYAKDGGGTHLWVPVTEKN